MWRWVVVAVLVVAFLVALVYTFAPIFTGHPTSG